LVCYGGGGGGYGGHHHCHRCGSRIVVNKLKPGNNAN
jgi:hypothetical protein